MVVPLTVERRGIVDLEKELEQSAIGSLRGIEDHLDRLGMGAVIAICRIRHVAPRISAPGRDHTGQLTDEILHAPKAATGENSTFCRPWMSSTSLTYSPYPCSTTSSRG